jgi:hypothetical protein
MQTVYDLPWILPFVRESLRGVGNLNFDSYADAVMRCLDKVGTPSIQKFQPHSYTGLTYNFDAARPEIKIAITEAFYYLRQNRFLLAPAPTQHGAFLPHGQFLVTPRGIDWTNGVEPLPEDYNGYMKQFDSGVDGVVRQYVSEALNTYIRGAYFASTVMLGAAAEAAIYNLADAIGPAIKDAAKQATMKKRIADRGLERLFAYIEKTIVAGCDSGIIPYEVTEGTTRHLLSLFEYIKVQRNDAVHPKEFQVSTDSVRLSLSAFPLAFEKVEALIRKWCLANPNSL